MTMETASHAGTVLLVKHLPAEMVTLAASTLSRHLDISRMNAEQQLRSGLIRLGTCIDAPSEDQLLSLLRSLGVTSQIAGCAHGLTLSVQIADLADLAFLAPKLALVLQRRAVDVQTALQQPGGVILEDLNDADVAMLRKQIRRLSGLKTTLSNAHALCDLFVTKPLSGALSRDLGRYLALIGVVPCRFSGALASGLTVAQAKQICARFPNAGLIGLDRAFQRFDLFLTSAGDLAPQDVAEFLSTRTDLSGAMVECVTPLKPLKIENGLTRGVTRQFRADYAAIGLQTCACLGGC